MKKGVVACCTLLLVLFTTSCEKQENDCSGVPKKSIGEQSTKTQDSLLLTQMYQELVELSGSTTCETADAWGITAIGSKPCGGAAGYMAYKTSINLACFLEKANHFTAQTAKYASKHGLISDCSVPAQPKTVSCQNGKPVFNY
jgi:hypothetical protein